MNRNARSNPLRMALSTVAPGMITGLLLAAATPMAHAEFSVFTELGRTRYHMQESSATGQMLNREDGSLPMQRIGARWIRDELFAEVTTWQSTGEVRYTGVTQIGLPLLTSTQLQLSGFQLRTGHTWRPHDTTELALSAGVDQTRINRNILPGLGSLPLYERLTSTRAILGARAQTSIAPRNTWPLSVSMDIDVMPAIRHRLAVNSFGLYDPVTLAPGRHTDWRAALRLSTYPMRDVELWVGMEWQHWNIGNTAYQPWTQNGVPATLVRYPGSQQRLRHQAVGASWRF